MSRRRKAERRSQASADEAVRRASVEQDGDTPGTLRGGKEARQARLESRIRAARDHTGNAGEAAWAAPCIAQTSSSMEPY